MASPSVKKCPVVLGLVAPAESIQRHSVPTAAWRRLGSCLYPLAVATGVSLSGAAHAQLSDTIHPFIQTSISYDDNMLRQTELPGQSGELGDTSRTVQGGVLFERPISRQLLSGHAIFSRVKYNRFSEFDYDGKDVLGDWAWQVGNQLQGHLGTSFVETLTPFIDSNTDVRSLRTQRRHYGELNWLLAASWQAHVGYTTLNTDYDVLAQRSSNRSDTYSELGMDYLAASGSKVGLQLRRVQVAYDLVPLVGASNDYDQDEVKANVVWLVTGQTKLSLLAGWVRRNYRASSQPDNSGPNGRLTAEYALTGQVQLTAELWREFQVVEGGVIGSSLNKGGSLGGVWAVSAKTNVNARVWRENRAFSTINGFVAAGGLTDNTTSASLGVDYTPLQRVQLGLNLFRDQRSGNPVVGSRTFRSNGVALNAKVQF